MILPKSFPMQYAYCLSRVMRNKGFIHSLLAVIREEKQKELRTQS